MSQRDEHRKNFLREIEAMSPGYSMPDKFRDAVRMMAIALRSSLLPHGEEKDALEYEYRTYERKYGDEAKEHAACALVSVINALEDSRSDFLGHIMEEIGSANKGTQQFLTPDSVAKMMARIALSPTDAHHRAGDIITLNDPACGASTTLIEGAEELMSEGRVPQRDIVIYAEDLDFNAFNISFVQLTLLGYAAQVTRQNSLSMQVIEGPWRTAGWMLYRTGPRLALQRACGGSSAPVPPAPCPDAPAPAGAVKVGIDLASGPAETIEAQYRVEDGQLVFNF